MDRAEADIKRKARLKAIRGSRKHLNPAQAVPRR